MNPPIYVEIVSPQKTANSKSVGSFLDFSDPLSSEYLQGFN
jgi:hypothetical protein